MKQLTGIIFLVIWLLPACSSKKSNTVSVGEQDSVYYPYVPIYASAFEKGNPVYARSVLEVWRAFETGNIKSASRNFADSVLLILPDTVVRTTKENVLDILHKKRMAYEDVQCFVDSWMSVKTKETGDNLVFVWGRQDCTGKKKYRDYRVVHEIWRIDNNGKIATMEQYITHPN